MALLSEKAQVVFKHTQDKNRKREYNARMQQQERKAKREATARKVDDPTPCKPLQTPSPKLARRRNESQFEREIAEINKSLEL